MMLTWSNMMFLLVPLAALLVAVGLVKFDKYSMRPSKPSWPMFSTFLNIFLLMLPVGIFVYLNVGEWTGESKQNTSSESSHEMSVRRESEAEKAVLAFEKNRAFEKEAQVLAQKKAEDFNQRMKAFEAYELRMAEEARLKESEAKSKKMGAGSSQSVQAFAASTEAPIAIASSVKKEAQEKLATPEEARAAADKKALMEAIAGIAMAAVFVAMAWMVGKRRRARNPSESLPDVYFLEENRSKTLREAVGLQEKAKQRP